MRKSNRLFSEEQEKFIRENAKGISAKELTELVNRTFDLSVTLQQVTSFKTTNKIRSGLLEKRKKGEGAEFFNRNRTHIKVRDQETGELKWRLKHVVIWEEANGKVPDGHVLLFADQDPMNVALDNLILVSRRQLAVINKFKLLQDDKELNESVVTIADIMLKAAEKRKVI